MPNPTFSIFLDENASSQAMSHSNSTSSHKCKVLRDLPAPATKENVNPLTGLSFDSGPPLKKRKPSSSSALKVKPFPSSSKITSKSKRLPSSKDKGKKRAVLGTSGNRHATGSTDGFNASDAEQSQTALGNRRAYEFTVMPLANVTQAYDESEATGAVARANLRALEDDPSGLGMSIDVVAEENNIELCEATSNEVLPARAIIATEA
ncbi:hypothetical protein JB92DRAFT_3147740 [Gautieria morchelliformis]|nr:hypothetical protein JB92DRAFT_3147740 [Gautieria morchelliformis]